jgi:hypothetical protein
LINGVCSACPPNSVWNDTQNKCLCNPGYYLNGSGCVTCDSLSIWNGTNCVLDCPPKSIPQENVCVCITGYFLIQSSCLQCDNNAIYNQTSSNCNCLSGFFGNGLTCTACDVSCLTCNGISNKNCLSCPKSGVLNTDGSCGVVGQSNCLPGTFKKGTTCQNCPAGCETCSSVSLCLTCLSGYTLSKKINGTSTLTVCTSVPKLADVNHLITATGTVVGVGVVYQGITMSSMPIPILVANCSICNDLFVIRAITSIGTNPPFTVQYIPYSQYWFVITFSFPGTSFIPTF